MVDNNITDTTTMSSLFGLAEQLLSTTTQGGSSGPQPGQTAHRTGGHEYNTPHYSQQPQGAFNTQEVLSHATDLDEEGKGYIANAIQHVQDNHHQHQQQLDEGDLTKYGPLILNALSSISSKSGIDVGALVSGGLGQGGGNKLMALVLNEAGKSLGGAGGQEKQTVLNSAAMTLTKLVAQKQLSAFVGGSNSGGLGLLGIGETLLKSRFG